MQVVLLVVQLLIAVALIGCILIQRTAQDGGGLMGGGSTMGGLFTARGSANLLTRTTAILATCFLVNCLALGFMASHQHQSRSALDQLGASTASPTTNQSGANPAADAQKAPEESAPVSSSPASSALPSNIGAAKAPKPAPSKGGKSSEAPAGGKAPQVPVAR
ncbi:MAG: preprotein translocase subunit SecG [Bdellovibrionales bacterium]